jgi:hypothetical protein
MHYLFALSVIGLSVSSLISHATIIILAGATGTLVVVIGANYTREAMALARERARLRPKGLWTIQHDRRFQQRTAAARAGLCFMKVI